jgi:glycosyltransferase involved in cell wall biosynthesis
MPPALFPRSIQVSRLLKGLAARGWASTVVTPRLDDLSPQDDLDWTLAQAYAAQRIERIDALRSSPDDYPTWQRWDVERAGRRLAFDDAWAECAASAVRRIARRRRIDALVTFAQPWRDHLVGLRLRRWRRTRPWIAHFSDPWADNPYTLDQPTEERTRQQELEAQVVGAADVLMFTNAYAVDLVMAKYPRRWHEKVHVLPHAIDTDLRAEVDRRFPPAPRSDPRPFRLAHVGNLFIGRRTAHALFEAIAALNRRRPLAGELELVLVGAGSGWQEARDQAATLGVLDFVTFRGRVSHLESLAAMRDSDALVLIDAPAATNVFLPSKAADYLMYDKPVLALTPSSGPTADLMREAGNCLVDPDDVAGIADAIEALMPGRRAESASVRRRTVAERLAVSAVAARCAEILENAVLARRGLLPWLGLQ